MVITKTGNVETYTVDIRYERNFKPHQVLLPISETEIDKSLNSLEQNLGY